MENPISWFFKKLKDINNLIWHTPLSEFSKHKVILIKQLRIVFVAAKGFVNNKVQLMASALTFYSMMSVVPIAAIAFAIAKGFGLEQSLEEQLIKNFQAQREVLDWLITNARNALNATRGGYIAGIGVVILFWSVMSLLDHIESSFNDIWEIRVSRQWYRKFTDYLTIMLIAPVFIVLSGSITVFINTKLTEFMANSAILEELKPLVSFLVKLLPFIITWLILTVLYIVMPNTRVQFKSALIAGILAGSFLQFVQWLYIDLQFGITKLNAIYGSFAAIPLFLVWLQMSWIIVLLGAELSYANQNFTRYEFEKEALNISYFHKKALTLMIMSKLVKNFAEGLPPLSAEALSSELKIPVRLVNDIVQDLNTAGLVSAVLKDESKERLYQPAVNIDLITINYVLSNLEKKGVEQKYLATNKEFEKVRSILEEFEKHIEKSKANVLIKDL
ncbi:MAG TPA: YihY/virulence factor BrkB family protein [Bacteroidales bacterium]|nr:YihY/virulence factor BrkB family protein [Bacteroidales bacterium]HOU95113.1 YihY/virulence factor BrkB family protein [Bacteroidales bacterium]HQG36397.1 YihY/virulence factor BrkB family protein [Bacteroidales bacterium]HQG53429.1 YihY/virulence factor BrkB family protein [Bacteroidales bacterium]HQJ20533.1 YihY/virulence factor BrkB family protein [Bacteroidales bacterium]